MVTDTTFWIDLLEERRAGTTGPARHFLATHRTHELRVSLVTWGELAAGFPAMDSLLWLLRGVHVLPLPLHIAWEASRIERELRGARLGENDNWIAATARAWGQRLVSRDTAFDRVRGLIRVPY